MADCPLTYLDEILDGGRSLHDRKATQQYGHEHVEDCTAGVGAGSHSERAVHQRDGKAAEDDELNGGGRGKGGEGMSGEGGTEGGVPYTSAMAKLLKKMSSV